MDQDSNDVVTWTHGLITEDTEWNVTSNIRYLLDGIVTVLRGARLTMRGLSKEQPLAVTFNVSAAATGRISIRQGASLVLEYVEFMTVGKPSQFGGEFVPLLVRSLDAHGKGAVEKSEDLSLNASEMIDIGNYTFTNCT